MPSGSVDGTGCVEAERTKSNGRVLHASCATKKGVSSLSRVEARIASVRSWDNRLHCWRKRKADEQQRDEKRAANRIYYFCFHEDGIPSFPGGYLLRLFLPGI